ncbi:hypothetical protein HED63_28615 [Ochrobactrum cytisi]|nr:hypothetical protein [Brucella cytisi]
MSFYLGVATQRQQRLCPILLDYDRSGEVTFDDAYVNFMEGGGHLDWVLRCWSAAPGQVLHSPITDPDLFNQMMVCISPEFVQADKVSPERIGEENLNIPEWQKAAAGKKALAAAHDFIGVSLTLRGQPVARFVQMSVVVHDIARLERLGNEGCDSC